MPVFRKITDWPHHQPPQRIVSLVPSITETLHGLGLEERVIGITKFCVHPPHWFTTKDKIGGTKNIKPALIRKLNPDLVIANLEENVAEQVMEVADFTQVWLTDIITLNDALDLIENAAKLTGTARQGMRIASEIRENFNMLAPLPKPIKCAYLIWRQPYMAAGCDTFIHHLLAHLGFENVFGNTPRYPATDCEALKLLKPGLVMLSSEPYPFRASHLEELAGYLPWAHVILVDGEMFSWYGSRLLKAHDYFSQLLSSLKQYH